MLLVDSEKLPEKGQSKSAFFNIDTWARKFYSARSFRTMELKSHR
jgi:hypothetical protein